MNKINKFFRFYRTHVITNLINLFGLSIGFGTFFLIALFLKYETSYNSFYKDTNEIFKVSTYLNQGSGSFRFISSAPVPLGPELQKKFPELKAITRLLYVDEWLLQKDDDFFESNAVLYADTNLFSVFNFSIVEGGNTNTMLDAPFKIILTQTVAKKLFGNDKALGKSVKRNDDNYIITGVIKDIPKNSTFQFDALVSASSPNWIYKYCSTNWHNYFPQTFVKTISGANKQLLADKLTKISNENKDAEHQNEEVIINLTALKNLHIYNPDKEIPNVAKLAPILKLLFFLALLILIITIVNYTNLTVAQIFERKRFYGIHKMMGSGRIKILIHYLYHSGINYYAGIFFAICIMSMALPSVNNLFNLDISLSILTIKHVLFAFLFTVFIFIVISIYPLSEIFKLNESHAIKENNQRIGGVNIRKILIAAQFFITFLIVTTTLIIIKQSKFLINKEIGVQTNNRLILKTDHVNKDFFETKKEAFKQNLERVAEINITTVTNALPGNSYYVDNFWMPDQGAESKFFMKDICVDGNYIPAMGLELIAGRNFDKNPTTESDIIILSESAVKVLGFENPADAINEFVFKGAQNRNYRIVGVVKDFLFSSYESNNYGTLRFSPSENRFACIKYSGNKHYEILGAVEKEWKKMFSDIPFRYFYLDDKYEERFVDDITKAKATLIFSTIAIILAAIGLFGISYFTVLKREKEFGIRKINGAKISEVFYLIFAEFSKIVVIVCLFAIPVAYWLASIILVDYTFKIDLKWWLFIIPLLLIFFISIISVTYHAFKLALMNPIKIIRE